MPSPNPLVGAKPVFIISKIVGCFPVDFSSALYSMTVIVLSAIGQILVWYTFMTTTTPKFSDSVLEVMELIENAFIFSVITSGFCAFRKNQLNRIIRAYLTAHESLLKLGMVPTYRSKRSVAIASMFILGVCLGVKLNYDKSTMDITMNIFASILPKIHVHLYIVQFFAVMELAQDQFNTLVQGLKHKNAWFLESSVNVHSFILKQVKETRDMYVIAASLVVTQSSLSLMVYTYLFVEFPSKVEGIFIMLYETVGIVLVLHASEQTKIKAEAFNTELFRLMRESKDLCSNDKLHLYVTMKQTVNFTACGFFNLGYPLVTSIIAAATTYLVILIQFSIK